MGRGHTGLLGAMLSSMQTWGLPTCFSISASCILSKELPTEHVKNGQQKHNMRTSSSSQRIILQILLET